MRKFLLTIFWISNVGSIIQLLFIASASWIIFSGDSTFFDLTVNVFVTDFATWLHWVKTLIVALLGNLGSWILAIPILIIAPLKLVTGTAIGVWAYTVARDMPVEPAYT